MGERDERLAIRPVLSNLCAYCVEVSSRTSLSLPATAIPAPEWSLPALWRRRRASGGREERPERDEASNECGRQSPANERARNCEVAAHTRRQKQHQVDGDQHPDAVLSRRRSFVVSRPATGMSRELDGVEYCGAGAASVLYHQSPVPSVPSFLHPPSPACKLLLYSFTFVHPSSFTFEFLSYHTFSRFHFCSTDTFSLIYTYERRTDGSGSRRQGGPRTSRGSRCGIAGCGGCGCAKMRRCWFV
uniref:Uncharacterized protein n=1 Tax=Mycena chlorophos TaxID=658473 RepID=A0ABQ0L809_MYCCL|nr:predicted protein [Mycena chlorophos]